MHDKKIKSMLEKLNSLTKEELQRINFLDSENTQRQYKEFVENFNNNNCYICGDILNHCKKSNACLHWLLIPKGFKKSDFPEIYSNSNYFKIAAYVRWIASTEGFYKNVNDLPEEHSKSNIIDYTVKHNNIEWSFSCSKNDLKGHQASTAGNFPHYHMQIRKDNRIFIKYNDFHIPLNEHDTLMLTLFHDYPDKFKHSFGPGDGMHNLFDSENLIDIALDSKPVIDEKESTFHINTLICAEPGQTISGDEIADLMEECKRENVTLASQIHRIKGKITTIVSPGDGIPKPKPRKGRKKKTRRNM